MSVLNNLKQHRKKLDREKQDLVRRGNSDGVHGTSSMLSNESIIGNRTAPGSLEISAINNSTYDKENNVLGRPQLPPHPNFKTPTSRSKGSTLPDTPVMSTNLKRRSKSATGFASMVPLNNSSVVGCTPSSVRYNSMIQLNSLEYIYVNGNEYRNIRKLGQGGSCKVYECLNDQNQACAVKVVELPDDEDAARAFRNEVLLLNSLQGTDHVIKMFEYELLENVKLLYVVLEKGDVDFNESLKERHKKNKIDLTFLKFYWKEMLQCVKVIHDQKIVHADLKPANFLVVKNNLKLIDFGIASSIPTNQTSILKDNPNGTLSYMAPETLCPQNYMAGGQYKLPLKADVWSLGCILFQMVYGKLPFAHLQGNQMKMAALMNPNYVIEYPETKYQVMVDIMKRCLERNVDKRATVDELLKSLSLEEDDNQKSGIEDVLQSQQLKAIQLLLGDQNNTPNTTIRKLQRIVKGSEERKLEFDCDS